jgi:hypothetical protein
MYSLDISIYSNESLSLVSQYLPAVETVMNDSRSGNIFNCFDINDILLKSNLDYMNT